MAKGWAKKGELRGFLKVGPRKARVEISIQPLIGPKKAILSWRLRIEWNPRKTGPGLIDRLHGLLAQHLYFGNEGATEWLMQSGRLGCTWD